MSAWTVKNVAIVVAINTGIANATKASATTDWTTGGTAGQPFARAAACMAMRKPIPPSRDQVSNTGQHRISNRPPVPEVGTPRDFDSPTEFGGIVV